MEGIIRGAVPVRNGQRQFCSHETTPLARSICTAYEVICVYIVSFASYLLRTLSGNAISVKARGRIYIYIYSEDVLSLSMMLRSIGRYRNYGNVMRANWRILWEPIKTRLLGTEVEYYISDIQEIGYIAVFRPDRYYLRTEKKRSESSAI